MADSEEVTTSTTVTETPTEARTPVEQADEASFQASHTVVEDPAESLTLNDVEQTQEERFAQAREDALKNHNADNAGRSENSSEEEVVA